ncbi:hypothetical protein B0H63DRAFT_523722 [Podospora didyma]|uniref:NmrA-like domain-containing protein n=1 Tax=Podospora didyma TaxID=330526 RepID=A0AAE0NG94_9PEZI|nr:hypothetical protein B0H63DRAFT_523722 [Podospora didyma]
MSTPTKNRIERVAIAGATGNIGSVLTDEVLKAGKHTVTVLARAGGSNTSLPAGVKVAIVDYDDEDSLVAALKGQQFLVIAIAIYSGADANHKLVVAAAKAGVPHVMPNYWGADIDNQTYFKSTLNAEASRALIRDVEDQGVSTCTPMVCNTWYEYSLSMGIDFYGIDVINKKAVLFDDGLTKINTSTWRQCGRALAALLALPVHPSSPDDGKPTLSKWFNKPLYVSSFLLSQRDMVDSLHRVMGTTDADWDIKYEPSRERYEKAKEAFEGGDRRALPRCLYSCIFFPGGGGDYESTKGTANQELGLPVEDLDEATRRAIDMTQPDGWRDGFVARYSAALGVTL